MAAGSRYARRRRNGHVYGMGAVRHGRVSAPCRGRPNPYATVEMDDPIK